MRTIKKTHRKINLLNKTSLTNCRSNKKTLCKKASIEKNQKQRYIIVTVGPTGSGKTDMIHKLEKYLDISQITKDNYILIDDLIESDPYYKKKVRDILNEHCKPNIEKCNIESMVDNPSDELLDAFKDAYFKARTRQGCGKKNDKGDSCDVKNDKKFTKSLEEGKNIVFETTGEKQGVSPAAWFLTRHDWWKDEFDNIKNYDYKIIFAYSLVKLKELVKRNKSRAKKSIKKFIKNKTIAPRLPDIKGNDFEEKVEQITQNLINLVCTCFLNGNRKNTKYCGTYPINKTNQNLIVFDNNRGKGKMKIIYDHNNNKGVIDKKFISKYAK